MFPWENYIERHSCRKNVEYRVVIHLAISEMPSYGVIWKDEDGNVLGNRFAADWWRAFSVMTTRSPHRRWASNVYRFFENSLLAGFQSDGAYILRFVGTTAVLPGKLRFLLIRLLRQIVLVWLKWHQSSFLSALRIAGLWGGSWMNFLLVFLKSKGLKAKYYSRWCIKCRNSNPTLLKF